MWRAFSSRPALRPPRCTPPAPRLSRSPLHAAASFSSRVDGQSHADPFNPHPLPSPHGPPLYPPASTIRVEEAEKRRENEQERQRREALRNESVRQLDEMIRTAKRTAEEGAREQAELVRQIAARLALEKEAIERRIHREEEERRRRRAEAEEQRRLQAQQETKAKQERLRRDERERKAREAADVARAEKVSAEQKAAAEAREVEQQRERARAEQRRAEAAKAQRVEAERSARARQEEELAAKQERERQERARWLAAQPKQTAAAPPPKPSPAASAAAPPQRAAAPQSRAELGRLEEQAVREEKKRQQQEERKERIIVNEERGRLKRAAEKEQADRQQREKETAQRTAAAEAKRQEAERARERELQEARKRDAEREKAAEAQRKADEERRLVEQRQAEKRRQEEEAKAAAEKERDKAKNEEVQRLQKQQQEDLIRSLQKAAATAPPPARPGAARASIVVLTPGAPPPPSVGGPSGTGPVVVSTPAAPVVTTDLRQRPTTSGRRDWLPYALIAVGGGLTALYFSRRERAESTDPVATSRIATERLFPARYAVVEAASESLYDDAASSKVALPELQRRPLRRSVEPPQLAPLPSSPAVREMSEEELDAALPSSPDAAPAVSSASSASASSESSDSTSTLQQLLGNLETLHLQQLLTSLSDLHSEEADYLRTKLRTALAEQLHQLQVRVRELRSGVEVSMDAPLLAHRDEEHSGEQWTSTEDLKAYLTSLQRQYDFLTRRDPSKAATASAEASPASLSLHAERAKGEVEKQMAASFSSVLREHEEQTSAIVRQLVELERSIASSLLHRQLDRTVEQRVDEAVEEERERWKEVESQELRQQRDDFLALTRVYLLRQRHDLDRENDADRQRRAKEIDDLTQHVRAFLSAFQTIVRETQDSDRLHQVALAALALDSITREEEVEKEEESGRQRTAVAAGPSAGLVTEWRRLWRLRSEDEVIDAVVSSIPSHVLTGGVQSVGQLKRRWRRVQAVLKEEAFVPKAEERDGYGRSVWAQLTGKLFALLYLSPASASAAEAERVAGDAGEVGVIDRINAMVGEKRWSEVLSLESLLSPTTRALCEDWTKQVEDRVLVEQALQAVKARVICLSCAYDH